VAPSSISITRDRIGSGLQGEGGLRRLLVNGNLELIQMKLAGNGGDVKADLLESTPTTPVGSAACAFVEGAVMAPDIAKIHPDRQLELV
jgi:hypothetical protein